MTQVGAREAVRPKAKASPKTTPSIAVATSPFPYRANKGVDAFVAEINAASARQLMTIERFGVEGQLVKDLAKHLEISAMRMFDMLGIPKATAEKKSSAGGFIDGAAGQAAIGIVKLLGIAQGIVARSTANDAKAFGTAKWLGQWLERPQPALGGDKPADLLRTPTGLSVVARLLGSIESGSYQ